MPGTDLGGVYAAFEWKLSGMKDVLDNIQQVGHRADKAGADTSKAFDGAKKAAKDTGDAFARLAQAMVLRDDASKSVANLKRELDTARAAGHDTAVIMQTLGAALQKEALAGNAIRDIQNEIKGLGDEAQESARKAGGLGDVVKTIAGQFAVFGLAIQGIKALAGGFQWVSSQVTGANAEFEVYQTQLSVLLDGMDNAQVRMEELVEFAKSTPFELPGIIRAEKVMTAFGLTADNVQQKLGYDAEQIRTIIGDVAAGTGVAFEDMANYMGRFAAGSTGEVIMRLQELGIVTREQMKGVGLEFSKAGQLISPMDEATQALLGLMQERFGGMMDAQSQTFDGMISNLSDWAWNAKRIAAEPIFDAMKEQLGALLEYLGRAETLTAIEDLARGLADGMGKVVETIANVVNWFQRVDPVALKLGATFVGLGLALPSIAAGITAIGAALAVLSLNPITLAAAGIVAVGVGIAAVVDSVNKSAAELSQSQSDMSQKIAQSADGYEDYKQQMVDYLRVSRDLPANYSDQQIAINALSSGILVSEQNWRSYTSVLSQEVGPALAGLDEGMMNTRVQMEYTAQAMQESFNAEAIYESVSSFEAQMIRTQEIMAHVKEGLTQVFTPEILAASFEQMAQITNDHMSRMQDLELQNNDALAGLRMNYLDASAENEAAYQVKRQQLQEAGKTEELATLDAKHVAETAQNSANYQKQLALQEISNMKARIAQQRAYMQALQDQADQTRRELLAMSQKALAEGRITATQQAVIAGVIKEGASAKLKNEIEYAEKSLNISTELANGQVDTAAGAMQALLDIQDGNIEDAKAAMAKMTADLDKMMRDLIANTAVSTAGLMPIAAAAGAGAARAATEPATKTLSQVASDINAAIKSIKEAIATAPSIIWTPSVAAAFDRVGEAIKNAVSKMYSWMDSKPEGGKKIGDMVKELQKYMGPLVDLMKVLSTDTTKWRNTSATLAEDVLDLIGKLKFASGEVYKWLELMNKDTRKALEEMQPVAQNLKALYDLLSVDLAKVVPQGEGWFEDAWRWFGQMKWFSARVYEWMMGMDAEAKANLDMASKVSDSLKGLFGLLGIDLAKAVPAGGDFFKRAWTWYGQMRWFSGRMYEWMMELTEQQRLNVAAAAQIAKDMKELFSLLGTELAKAVPVQFRFKEKAWSWYGQMRWISGRIYEWMMEIKKDATINVGAAGDVAAQVKKLFEVIDVDLAKIVPIGGVSWRQYVEDYFDQLKELGRQIMNWLGYLSEDTRAQVKATAETAGHVKEMFSLFEIKVENVRPLGTRAIANVMGWFADLKTLFNDMMPQLLEMNDDYGDAVEVVGSLVDKIATLFERIDDAAQAIAGARRVGGLHIGTARDLLNQLMGLLTYINALSTMPISLPPSIGGVGGGPSAAALHGAGGGVVIQQQRIVLFEGPVTVQDANALVDVITARMQALVRPLSDMGKLYAIKGAGA